MTRRLKSIPWLLGMAAAGCASMPDSGVECRLEVGKTASLVFANAEDRPAKVTAILGRVDYLRSVILPDGSIRDVRSGSAFRITEGGGTCVVEPGRIREVKIRSYRPPRDGEMATVQVEYQIDGVWESRSMVVKGPVR
jgi:hypothetical protein